MTPTQVLDTVKASGLQGRGAPGSYWAEVVFRRSAARANAVYRLQCG